METTTLTPNLHLAVYGTLMRGHGRAILDKWADYVGPCRLRGDLYAVHGDAFPALVPGEGTVTGELWRARSPQAMQEMLAMTDSIEGYRPGEGERHSMYLRRGVETLDGERTWTYVWNGDRRYLAPIPSGCWRTHMSRHDEVWREGGMTRAIQTGQVCGTCADEGATECDCWAEVQS
jgi:gamma-glutamylcyclotransferase (GGCT)/AIG2-like uncharacterized protein YtfP